MTNEKVHITIELPRDYRVWDLRELFMHIRNLPGKIVDITGVEHISGERYSVPASEALSKPGEWVPHYGTECPVHPLDMINVKLDGELGRCSNHQAAEFRWDCHGSADVTHYRHVTDSEGIPYVYDDGSLPQWAEYVATDRDGCAYCYPQKPEIEVAMWHLQGGGDSPVPEYANTLIPFTESLRRIWREE